MVTGVSRAMMTNKIKNAVNVAPLKGKKLLPVIFWVVCLFYISIPKIQMRHSLYLVGSQMQYEFQYIERYLSHPFSQALMTNLWYVSYSHSFSWYQ